MRILLKKIGTEKVIADLVSSILPLNGDEIAVLDGPKSATYTVIGRTFFPIRHGSQGREEYVVITVK